MTTFKTECPHCHGKNNVPVERLFLTKPIAVVVNFLFLMEPLLQVLQKTSIIFLKAMFLSSSIFGLHGVTHVLALRLFLKIQPMKCPEK